MIGLNEILSLLGELHRVAPSKRAALRARLKHFQSLGFPHGVNPGRGRRVEYSAGQIFQLHLALEFAQIGLPPETIVDLMQSDGHRVRTALRLALFGLDKQEFPTFIYVDPHALAGLTDGEDLTFETLHYAGVGTMKDMIDSWWKVGLSRLALIDLSSVVFGIRGVIPAFGEGLGAQFIKDLEAWACDENQRLVEDGLMSDGDDQEA